MSFREQLAQDMKVTFFNTSEFAEKHQLGDQEVPLIIDEDELQKRQIKAAEGTYLGDLLILVEAKRLKSRPIEGKPIKFDGKIYFVSSCKLIDGIYEVIMGANESW